MEIVHSLIYGIIQGLTEFLPVSSSGHLALLPFLMKFKDPGVVFDLAMHVGTALAVLVYFFKDVRIILLPLLSPKTSITTHKNFSFNSIVATVSSVILILILRPFAKEYGRDIFLIAFQLAFFGILMIFIDKRNSRLETQFMEQAKDWKRAILIGLSQSIAIFPGVSRSGITLTMARHLGMGRVEASRFSFLLSLPIILGGFIIKLPEVMNNPVIKIEMILIGVITSFLVGLLTIHYFLKLIQRVGLVWFGVYRVLLAVLLVIIASKT